jgi:hypothetical protein
MKRGVLVLLVDQEGKGPPFEQWAMLLVRLLPKSS